MPSRELLVATKLPDLAQALNAFEGLELITTPTLTRAASTIVSSHPPAAVYVEDSCGTVEQLWNVVHAALERGLPIFVGLHGVGLPNRRDFENAGLPVTSEREPQALAAWLAAELGARPRAAANGQVVVAVAGAKGGIGKTLLVAVLAEGLKRRGLRVLIVDGDVSNSGIVPIFRIPSGFLSYLQIQGDGPGAYTPANVRRYIYKHPESGIDFLLAAEETAEWEDLTKNDWLAMMQAIRTFDDYDVVLVDTGPEIIRRPYALHIAKDGGWVILPTPPSRQERLGVANALRVFQSWPPDLTDRCFMIYIEPERGVEVTVQQVAPLFASEFARARVLGTFPRAARQVSRANEEGDRYISPLDIAPHSGFSRAVHDAVDAFCRQVGLRPKRPKPRSSLWQQLKGRLGREDPAPLAALEISLEQPASGEVGP